MSEQFGLEIRENGDVLAKQDIEDPFIHTTIEVSGLRNALRVLFRRHVLTVHVTGTREAHRVVFSGDYSFFGDAAPSEAKAT